MKHTPLEIYKYLPKTNCGECGIPTCLAFSVKLTAHQIELSECPYLSEDAKQFLAIQTTPPIRLVRIGTGTHTVEIGDEKVLFRHEKTFYHPTAIGLRVDDSYTDEEIKLKLTKFQELKFQRVGENLSIEFICITSSTSNAERYAQVVKTVVDEGINSLILRCENNIRVIEYGLKVCADLNPLIGVATSENYDTLAKLTNEYKCPLSVGGTSDLNQLEDVVTKISSTGVVDIVLDIGEVNNLSDIMQLLTIIRRLAIEYRNPSFGYPTMVLIPATSTADAYVWAAVLLMKYSSIIILDRLDKSEAFPVLTLRQNIFSDPQKPIQMDAGIYPIGKPDDRSPVLITTNFSLTFFTVTSDLEASKVPSWLLIIDTEGQSVLTAWASGKFTADTIAKFLNTVGITEKVSHRNIIIPGQVARLSGKLEELSGWKVIVGPLDSSGLPTFLRNRCGGYDINELTRTANHSS